MSTEPPPDIHRTLPNSNEAEMGVIGSMMLGGYPVIEELQSRLTADAFYNPIHSELFTLLVILYTKGVAVDLITVTAALGQGDLLERMGGAGYITSLFTFVPTSANVQYYADIVRDKYVLRQIIQKCTEGVRRAYDEAEDASTLADEVQGNIVELGQFSRNVESLVHIAAAIPEVVAGIETTFRNRGKPIGLPTGFPDLDRMTGGLQGGRTYYFGARPAMGKSSLGTELAEHVAIDNADRQVPVAIFSVEMTTHELTEVMLCRRAQVNLLRLRDGFFSKEQHDELKAEAERMKSAPIYIDDKADLSIFEFKARARRAVVKFKARLIIVDFIQRLKSTSKRAQGNREQEISEIALGISVTAKELNVPIIVLAQINRKSEDRTDKIPELADFRESGSLEQEAHFVGLLHRPDYYCKSEEKKKLMAEKYGLTVPEFEEYTMLIVAKQRRGPVGTIRLKFIKQLAAFINENEHRALYSNREEDRQVKQDDPHAAPPPPAAEKPPRLVQDALEMFPGSKTVSEENSKPNPIERP
jgi:replicative DNA helicase